MQRLIQSYADAQAELRPMARAIVFWNESLTYAQLHRWSNSLARAMQSHGCRRGDRVGLMVSKSPLSIASILAVLKADCIYVPLDVDSPEQRIVKILENSEPRLLLVDESGTKKLQELWSHSTRIGFKAASLECRSALSDRNPYVFCGDDIGRFSDEPIHYQSAQNDPAYIMYTSGSTGVPKGVPVTHASVAHFIDWATAYFNFTSDDRI